MRLETTAGNFSSAMRVMAGIVERRNTKPVLGAAKFENGKVIGTNLDTEVELVLPAAGRQEGAAAIDVGALSRLARHIPADDAVAITESDGLATIEFNGGKYTVPSYPAGDFPDFGAKMFYTNAVKTGTHNAGLIDAMRAVRFAGSTEEVRYYLNGIAFVRVPDDGGMAAVATDGHRLAIKPLPFPVDGAEGKIVHWSAVKVLAGQKAEPNTLTFDSEGKAAQFAFPGMKLRTRLIDATYPDIWRVVPKDTVDYFTVDRLAMLSVLRRIAAFVGGGRVRAVKISANNGAAGLTLTVNSTDIGTCTERFAADIHAPEPFECGFNFCYLVDALSALKKSERATFAAKPDGAIRVRPTAITGDHDDLMIVQMPMRV